MGRLGSLPEWERFLQVADDQDAIAALMRLARQVDGLYADVSSMVVRLYDSPTGEVADVLLIARTALAEAAGMLESVASRFDAGEREPA